jgi:hypothetical protein
VHVKTLQRRRSQRILEDSKGEKLRRNNVGERRRELKVEELAEEKEDKG